MPFLLSAKDRKADPFAFGSAILIAIGCGLIAFSGSGGSEQGPLMLASGACLAGLGAFFLFSWWKQKRSEAPIPADWLRQAASRVEVRRPIGDRYLPARLEVSFELSGTTRSVASPELFFDPLQDGVMPGPPSAAYPPGKPDQARLDFAGWPLVRVASWRPIALKEFIAHIQQSGREIVAGFAGWKQHGASEDDSFERVLAVLQYRDRGSEQLFVFEAFALSDEKGPLPQWPLGTRFCGWYDPRHPDDFHFEESPLPGE